MVKLSKQVKKDLKIKFVQLCQRNSKDNYQKLADAVSKLSGLQHNSVYWFDKLSKNPTAEDIKRQLKELKKDPKIQNIELTASYITVTTAPIKIKHKDTTYFLGNFLIKITKNGYVMFENKTMPVFHKLFEQNVKFDHPNILFNTVVVGNIVKALPEIIGSKNFLLAIKLCIQHISSYKEESAFAPIDLWPVFKPIEK